MSSKLAALCLSWLQKAGSALCEVGGMPFQHINSPFTFPVKVAQAEPFPNTVLLVSFCPRVSDFLTPNRGSCRAPAHEWVAGIAGCASSRGQVACGKGRWLMLLSI